MLALLATPACGADESDDEEDEPKSEGPNIYLDITSGYSVTPGGALLLGPRFLPFATSASKSFAINAPLTIDLTDRFSLYAGLDASTSRAGATSWSKFQIGNWSTGFSADIVEHKGWLPTVTLTGSVVRPVKPPAFGALTTWSAGLDLDLPIDKDETRGVIAGTSVSRSILDHRGLGSIRPTVTAYGGAYYQWESGWKLTGRAGFQTFGGANIGSIVQLKRTTLKFVALDYERLDDNDNKLFGLSLALGWSPKPAVQLTLSTPLYFLRN